MKKWIFPLVVTMFLAAFPGQHLLGCDDTLLALLTSTDPSSEFSRSIRQFNRELTELGTALKYQKGFNAQPLMQKVMEAWLAFSNKYNVNPPEMARGDPNWSKKIMEIADRIGAVNKAIGENNIEMAHQSVLALSSHLTSLFEFVGLSPLKRSFLQVSDFYGQLDQCTARNALSEIPPIVASLDTFLATFTHLTATDTAPMLEKVRLSLVQIEQVGSDSAVLGSPTRVVQLRLDQSRTLFQEFRARLLMNEWFPNLKTNPATATPGDAH